MLGTVKAVMADSLRWVIADAAIQEVHSHSQSRVCWIILSRCSSVVVRSSYELTRVLGLVDGCICCRLVTSEGQMLLVCCMTRSECYCLWTRGWCRQIPQVMVPLVWLLLIERSWSRICGQFSRQFYAIYCRSFARHYHETIKLEIQVCTRGYVSSYWQYQCCITQQ